MRKSMALKLPGVNGGERGEPPPFISFIVLCMAKDTYSNKLGQMVSACLRTTLAGSTPAP